MGTSQSFDGEGSVPRISEGDTQKHHWPTHNGSSKTNFKENNAPQSRPTKSEVKDDNITRVEKFNVDDDDEFLEDGPSMLFQRVPRHDISPKLAGHAEPKRHQEMSSNGKAQPTNKHETSGSKDEHIARKFLMFLFNLTHLHTEDTFVLVYRQRSTKSTLQELPFDPWNDSTARALSLSLLLLNISFPSLVNFPFMLTPRPFIIRLFL